MELKVIKIMTRQITLSIVIMLFLGGGCLLQNLYAQEVQAPPETAREHYELGVSYGKQGKYADAIVELEQAVELHPAYADAYNALGVVYYLQKDQQQAIEQYLLAIEADPKHVKARTNLAIVYSEQQEYRKAVQQLEKALELDPNYAPAQELLEAARPKADAQDAKELERQQKEAQRTPPPEMVQPSQDKQKAAKALFDAGTRLIKQGKIDAGMREYKKGLELHPQSAEGFTLLGMAYREKYRATRDASWRQEEIIVLSKAIQLNPKYVPALLGLGEVLYEQGEVAQAIPYFQKVLQYAPNHPAKEQLETIIRQNQP
jgi:superkiller protein 3